MELDFAMLASHAEVNPDGRVFILSGGLDAVRIAPPGTPGTAPSPGFYFIARMRFSPDECGRDHVARIEMIDPRGTIIVRVENPTHPPVSSVALKFCLIALIALPPQGITFGEYQIRFLVDDEERKTIPLTIELAPTSQPS